MSTTRPLLVINPPEETVGGAYVLLVVRPDGGTMVHLVDGVSHSGSQPNGWIVGYREEADSSQTPTGTVPPPGSGVIVPNTSEASLRGARGGTAPRKRELVVEFPVGLPYLMFQRSRVEFLTLAEVSARHVAQQALLQGPSPTMMGGPLGPATSPETVPDWRQVGSYL